MVREEKEPSLQHAIAAFAALGADEKVSFLIVLAHELTIRARDTYEVGGKGLENPERMRSYNEIQHRVLGFLAALHRGDVKRYPDDVLVQIILEHLQMQCFSTICSRRMPGRSP